MKKQFLIIFGIIFLISIQFFLLNAEGDLIDICAMNNSFIDCGDDLTLSGSGFLISDKGVFSFGESGGKLILNEGKKNQIILEGTKGVEISDLNKIVFKEKDAKLIINGNSFENIDSEQENLITLDQSTGRINSAFFHTDEKGGNYFIEGLEFRAFPNSLVSYDGEKFFIPDGEIIDVQSDILIDSENLLYSKFKGDHILSGLFHINKQGNLFVDSGTALVDGLQISSKDKINFYFDDSFNPLEHLDENYYYSNLEDFYLHSKKGSNLDSDFLENNYVFDINEEGLASNEQYSLSFSLFDGDLVKIKKRPGNVPLVYQESSETGKTLIKSGRHYFVFKEEEFFQDLRKKSEIDFLSVPFDLTSSSLNSKDYLLQVNDQAGYAINDLKTGENVFSFDMGLLDNANYYFKSDVQKKFYEVVKAQEGKASYVSEGRGPVCYPAENNWKAKKLPKGQLGFDCIGLPLYALLKTYPGTTLRDFSPSLKLSENLEERGWDTKIVEPSSIKGDEQTEKEVYDIPAGSIVFLVSPVSKGNLHGREGYTYKKYIDSKGEELFLEVSHTLVRGAGEKNFINAHPNHDRVLASNLVPEYNYMVVISPPKEDKISALNEGP